MAKGVHPKSLENLTPWQPGKSGNPGGLTRAQLDKIAANRDKAAELETRLLDALKKDMDENEAAIIDHIKADVLKLINQAHERHDGRAKQSVDVTSSDGSMSPQAEQQEAILAALKRKHDPDA